MTERTPEEWATWWREFKRRNKIPDTTEPDTSPLVNVPTPPDDAPTPPRPHTETEREVGEEG